MSFLNFIILTF